jgi:transposase
MKKRMLLVKLVLKKGVPISQAIEEIGLKITTARFIINKYKETGTFPRRKFKKRVSGKNHTQTCKVEENDSKSESLDDN